MNKDKALIKLNYICSIIVFLIGVATKDILTSIVGILLTFSLYNCNKTFNTAMKHLDNYYKEKKEKMIYKTLCEETLEKLRVLENNKQ